MERSSIEQTTPVGDDGVDRRRLSESLGASDLAITHYRVAPGTELPAGLHAHADQEEVFIVLDGTATYDVFDVETDDSALLDDSNDGPLARELVVEPGETVRFAPGEFQSGRNDGDEELRLLAVGAPPESDDVRIPVDCPECDHEDLRLDVGEPELSLVCPHCEAERAPTDCPACSDADLRMTLENGKPVAGCAGCGATFDRPPVAGSW